MRASPIKTICFLTTFLLLMTAGAKIYFYSEIAKIDREIIAYMTQQENVPEEAFFVVPRHDAGMTNDVVENETETWADFTNRIEIIEETNTPEFGDEYSYWASGSFQKPDDPIIFIHTDGHVQRGDATLSDTDIIALARHTASNAFGAPLVYFLAEPPANTWRVMQVKALIDENGARARDFDWGPNAFKNPFFKKLP